MQGRTMAVIAGGIAGHLLAMLCWYAGWQWFQVDFLKFWVNLILPAGALCLGMIGGAGFWFAARLVKRPATPGLKWIAALIAIAAAVGIRFLGYWSIEFGGVPIHDFIGFGDYLQATLGHARMDFTHGGRNMGSVELGQIGYLMEAIQSACYALGSFVCVAALPPAVRCKRHGVMRERHWRNLRLPAYSFEGFYQGLPAGPAERLAALDAAEPGNDVAPDGAIELHYRLAECEHCSMAALAESGKVHNGKYWVPFKPMTRVALFDRNRTAAPQPAAPVVPGPRGFGRRTTTI